MAFDKLVFEVFMRVVVLPSAGYASNSYLVIDDASKKFAVVDPSVDPSAADSYFADGYSLEYVLLTHGHFDHLMGAEQLRDETGAVIAALKQEKELVESAELNASLKILRRPITCKVDHTFTDGEVFHIGDLAVKVMHTPGHTSGGCCYVTDEAIFTGDTLMGYSIGRCDLPTGDAHALMASLRSLTSLPGDPDICGGHGPVTKLSEEKRRNPYL